MYTENPDSHCLKRIEVGSWQTEGVLALWSYQLAPTSTQTWNKQISQLWVLIGSLCTRQITLTLGTTL